MPNKKYVVMEVGKKIDFMKCVCCVAAVWSSDTFCQYCKAGFCKDCK